MNIYLGNLSATQLEKRCGVVFPVALMDFLEANQQMDVSIRVAPGKWHCFDMPFYMVCGDYDTAKFVYDQLKEFDSDFLEDLSIGLSDLSSVSNQVVES